MLEKRRYITYVALLIHQEKAIIVLAQKVKCRLHIL